MLTPTTEFGADDEILVLESPDTVECAALREICEDGLLLARCQDADELCRRIRGCVAAVLLAEETLDSAVSSQLQVALADQPPWSDLPLIVLPREHSRSDHLRETLNVVLVERPITKQSLLCAIRAARRSRERQYQLRQMFAVRERTAVEQGSLANALQLALDAGGLGTWEWDPTTDRMHLSARAAEVYGAPGAGHYQREELRALLHRDYRDMARNLARHSLETRTDYDIEYPLENSATWIGVRGRYLFDAAGQPIRLLGVVQDITSTKLSEQRLRATAELNAFLTRLADATQPIRDPDQIMAVSARLLAEELRVDRCAYAKVDDESVFTITGDYSLTLPSIVGQWPVQAFGAECVRQMRANEPYVVADTENDSRISADDLPAYRATNIRAVICVPLHKDGKFTAAMAVHQSQPRQWDCSEVRLVTTVVGRCWEALERSLVIQALRDADRQKDDFIALLAHELRNPLAPIRTGMQVLQLVGNDSDTAAATRAMMDRQLAHMVRLIDDLLDVSRISRNKMELRLSPVDLVEILDSAIETARPAIEAAGHRLFVALPNRPAPMLADLTRLAQVFANLLTNCAKFTKPGGTIWVTAILEPGLVRVQVQDTGIGIPADALARVFQLFSQLDRSIERVSGGLGIGLALVKGLVELHGGTVVAQSEGLGSGATFTVELPALTEEHQPKESIQNPKVNLIGGRRILVVDDNLDGAETLRLMLQQAGNEVRTAGDGLEAVQIAEEFQPQIILMDLGMPRMNGYEATRRIRQQSWSRNSMIVALTGWGQELDRQKSRDAGCDAHLVKPVSIADLLETLSGLTQRNGEA